MAKKAAKLSPMATVKRSITESQKTGNLVMDPPFCAQDILRCHLCETPVPPLCCEVCDIYLCKVCAGEHILQLDQSTKHSVVPITQTLSALLYPKCLKHSSRKCELYCKQCTIPICVQCVSSKEHRGHGFKDLLECVEGKREVSQKDLQELESSILTEHKEFASRIRNQKANLNKTLKNLNSSIDAHGEKLHKQVSDVVEKFKSEIVKEHKKKFAAMTKTEDKIALTISEIENCILSAKELQASRDLGLVFKYKSRNEEFRYTPPDHDVTLPTFAAYEIKKDELYEQFGSLTRELNIRTPDDNLYTMEGSRRFVVEENPQYNETPRRLCSKCGRMCPYEDFHRHVLKCGHWNNRRLSISE